MAKCDYYTVMQNKEREEEEEEDVLGVSTTEGKPAFCQSTVSEQVWAVASMGRVPTGRQYQASTTMAFSLCHYLSLSLFPYSIPCSHSQQHTHKHMHT